jgi:hypothetical protein
MPNKTFSSLAENLFRWFLFHIDFFAIGKLDNKTAIFVSYNPLLTIITLTTHDYN